MLYNLETIHQPDSLDEAIHFLRAPGTFPLYAAALQRNPRPDVQAVVDLSRLGLAYVRDSENSLRLGSMLTLEQVRAACAERGADHPKLAGLAQVLQAEAPETLRHTLTLADLLVERDPQSPTLTLLLAFEAAVKRLDLEMRFPMSSWLALDDDVWRTLIGQVRMRRGPQRAAVAYEKVARTPADAPIVGALAYVQFDERGQRCTDLALCGVAPTPIAQPDVAHLLDEGAALDAALDALRLDPPDDHWGSREYRTEMARVVSRRALLRAQDEAAGR